MASTMRPSLDSKSTPSLSNTSSLGWPTQALSRRASTEMASSTDSVRVELFSSV